MATEDHIDRSETVDVKLPRTMGAQGLFGFDLGPVDRSVMVGLAAAQLYTFENDVQEAKSETFFGLGGGFRFGAI
jgi:hypothetical protein